MMNVERKRRRWEVGGLMHAAFFACEAILDKIVIINLDFDLI